MQVVALKVSDELYLSTLMRFDDRSVLPGLRFVFDVPQKLSGKEVSVSMKTTYKNKVVHEPVFAGKDYFDIPKGIPEGTIFNIKLGIDGLFTNDVNVQHGIMSQEV